MPVSFTPRTLSQISWSRDAAPRSPAMESAVAEIRTAVRRVKIRSAKLQARAMRIDRWRLDMIEEGLSEMPPVAMADHVEELLRAAIAESGYSDPIIGRTELTNLRAAAIVARWLRRRERIDALISEAA